MKACSVCKVRKPAGAFQVRQLSADGRTAACRDCLKARDAARYPKEREQRNEWSRSYYKTAQGKEAVDRAKRKWRDDNANKRAAHVLLSNALRAEKLKKKPCEVCGSTVRIHGHHDDYSKPLTVRWLCPRHHAEIHHQESR